MVPTGKYKILKYSGDTDGVVPTYGTQQWIAQLVNDTNLTTIEDWSPWTVGGQIGGYVTKYDKNFTFTTVHGAGHMVPQWQRQRAYHAIFNWIKNEDY